ncbi:hypothetical protein E2C01_096539 [Portunus trituberculatus]|uniref:Uncharacterized protein n=1 Tax=Portunus trituberculatus TaxID=210409 RepID=A0A5B7K7A2_PORTR|nr:hypothetical protein [Portunus trituberculatus]
MKDKCLEPSLLNEVKSYKVGNTEAGSEFQSLPEIKCHVCKKPLVNERWWRKRLNAAKKYKDWPLKKCHTVLRSDGSTLQSGGGRASVLQLWFRPP